MTVSMAHFIERNARVYPDKLAVSHQDVSYTWSAYAQRAGAIAGALNKLGLRKGDRIAYLGLNSADLHILYFAPCMGGMVLVPMNYRLAAREMIQCMQDCGARVLISDDTFLDLAQTVVQELPDVTWIVTDDVPPRDGTLRLEDLIAEGVDPSEPQGAGDDTLIIYYSGGTTGKPKGVELSHWNLFVNATGTAPAYGFKPFERHLLVGPMFHLAAGARVYTCAVLPAEMVLQSKFEPRSMLKMIEEKRINTTQLVPAMFQAMLDLPEFGEFDLSSIRQISWGASPATEELMRRVVTAFPDIDLVHAFGMTEASPVLTVLGPEYHRADFMERGKLGSVGLPLAHVDLKICDEKGVELPTGERGEVVTRGPHIMKGYIGQPELTASVIKDGWYHTGDAGYLDADGCLWISGRIKDMIISGGENVYPGEVENILSLHEAVAEVAVIGIPHEKWGEAVHAIVILHPGVQPDEAALIGYCRDNLAHYKCPRSVTFRTEPFPLSGANKILKRELRKDYWPAE